MNPQQNANDTVLLFAKIAAPPIADELLNQHVLRSTEAIVYCNQIGWLRNTFPG
jgi:hypothetical protein